MARVANCNDCGAKFKVPETTQAARSKCPKCGGVVTIPPAEDSSAAAAPAARPPQPQAAPAAAPAPKPATPAAGKAAASTPARAAPSRSAAPAASAARGGASRSSGRGRSKAGGASKGGASKGTARKGKAAAGRSGRGGARRGKGERESASNTGMIVGVVVALLIAGGAGWWFGFRDDGSAGSNTPAVVDDTSTARDDSGSGDASSAATESAVSDSPSAPASGTSDSGSPAGSALAALTAPGSPGEQAPAATDDVAQAPAATDPSKVSAEEPLPTLIEFEPFGPVEGTTQDQLDGWTAMLRELYIEDGGATGRTRKRLRAQAAEIDIIEITPAFLNAIRGVDLIETHAILGVFTMVKDWQERVGFVPRFFFDGDVNATEIIDQNKRVKVVQLWVDWWSGYASGKNDLVAYRKKMEKAVKARAN